MMRIKSMITAVAAACVASFAPAALAQEGVKVGDKAPMFALKDTEGKTHKLEDLMKDDTIVVLEWYNPQCPFVVKHHKTFKTMHDTAKAFKDKKVKWVAINSGAEGKQGAGVELNKKYKKEYKIDYPILMDMDGKIGKAYGAKTSPHMFVIAEGKIAYMGAIDSDRSPRKLGETNYVLEAVSSLLAGETIDVTSTRPYGCSVKYSTR